MLSRPFVLAHNPRVWAEGLGPDGICMDAEGAIWVQTQDAPHGAVVRIREGGEVLERVEHDRAIFALMLGGPDRTTLFLLANEWRGIEHVDEALAARTGQVLITRAPATRRRMAVIQGPKRPPLAAARPWVQRSLCSCRGNWLTSPHVPA